MSSKWELIGYVEVRNGLLMLVDPMSVTTEEDDGRDHPVHGIIPFHLDEIREQDFWNMGKDNSKGMLLRTGDGLGEYPVYVQRKGNLILEMKVVFDN